MNMLAGRLDNMPISRAHVLELTTESGPADEPIIAEKSSTAVVDEVRQCYEATMEKLVSFESILLAIQGTDGSGSQPAPATVPTHPIVGRRSSVLGL